MTYIFYETSEFNGNISGWDTGGVTDMTDVIKSGILRGFVLFIQLMP